MPVIKGNAPTYGGCNNSPRSGSYELGNTLDGPAKLSDQGQASKTSVAHHWPASKGENPRDYPQIAGGDGAVTRELALKKDLAHGARGATGEANSINNMPVLAARSAAVLRTGRAIGRMRVSALSALVRTRAERHMVEMAARDFFGRARRVARGGGLLPRRPPPVIRLETR
jgi:hypothetical protein